MDFQMIFNANKLLAKPSLGVYKRKSITLIEILIVMFFISLITGVIAFNLKGSLDEGKAFKTKESISQLTQILELEISQGNLDPDQVESDWETVVSNSTFVANAHNLLKDGWGVPFSVTYDDEEQRVIVTSLPYTQYLDRKQEQGSKSLFDDR